jgi:iron complex transport system permease protein
MLLASKAGNTATGYVLAGVVIGLAFTSVQTVILTTSDSDKLHNAISWLYGSFTSVDWGTVWLIFFPALFISFAFFIWAKELNLVLLGDDNAQQMGLNVKRFDAIMLIMASVLTSVCVAFVGIIGFVGLVVPHVCRMILGGDHRLVLPASMVLGAALMLLADLLARMIMIPLELPVGAITTVVGVPLFAYLLVKRGKMYNG